MTGSSLLRVLVLAMALCLSAWPTAAQGPEQDSWTGDRDLLLFFDAVGKIKKHSVKKLTTGQIVRQALHAFLPTIDPYSQYLTAKQFAEFKKLQSPQFFGVGMEIAGDQPGRIICLPYPGGPAAREGVKGGDLLLRVDGKRVSGLSLTEVATLIRGKPKTFVDLLVRSKGSKPREIRIMRAKLRNISLTQGKAAGVPVIRMIRFSNTTPSELRAILRGHSKAKALILDLRSNPGGDLASAVDAAALFLPKGRVIAEIKERGKSKVYRSTSPPMNLPVRVFIWQNHTTASAAEVFIAALTQNRRAVSIGSTTYGKGTRQSIIPLLDGSALIISDAKILTPNGSYYHGKGLAPDHALKAKSPGRKAYAAVVKKLMAAPPKKAASPEMRVSLSTSRPTRKAKQREVFVVCFKKKFKDQRAADIFSVKVQRSVESGDHYLIRLKDGRIQVCTGPYLKRDAAETRMQKISTSLSDPDMFVSGMGADTLAAVKAKAAPAAPAATAKPPKAQVQPPVSWAIRVGVYSNPNTAKDSALDVLQKLKKHGLTGYVDIKGFKGRAAAKPAVAFFKVKGFKAKWLVPCDQGTDRCLAQYWVYVGPYPKEDVHLLEQLIKEKKVPEDALWTSHP